MRKMLEDEKARFINLFQEYQNALYAIQMDSSLVDSLQQKANAKFDLALYRYIIATAIIFVGDLLIDGVLASVIAAYLISANIGLLGFNFSAIRKPVEEAKRNLEKRKVDVQHLYELLSYSYEYLYTITDNIQENNNLEVDHSDILSYVEAFESEAYNRGDKVKRLSNRIREE